MAVRTTAWRRTGARARDAHFDGLEKGTWVEFPGYDNRGRQQGNVLAYLVEAGDDRQAGKGKVFESHVVAVQDGYYDYWAEETYGAYTLEGMVPLHFCGSPQASCGDATMYRHVIHVDVFRILPLECVLLVSWLTEEDKARASAHPGLVGDAPGLGRPQCRSCGPGVRSCCAAGRRWRGSHQEGRRRRRRTSFSRRSSRRAQPSGPSDRLWSCRGAAGQRRKRGNGATRLFSWPPSQRAWRRSGRCTVGTRASGIADLAALRGARRGRGERPPPSAGHPGAEAEGDERCRTSRATGLRRSSWSWSRPCSSKSPKPPSRRSAPTGRSDARWEGRTWWPEVPSSGRKAAAQKERASTRRGRRDGSDL